jgi:uncharacterized protein (DUF486 family)
LSKEPAFALSQLRPCGCGTWSGPARFADRATPASSESPRMIPPKILPIVLLTMSNVFMTTAWYGHLKFTDRPLWLVILVSWGIAFFEYCLAVPANRFGSTVYNTAELKTMQEVITLTVFVLFSIFYLKEPLTINHAVGFALIAGGAFFVFKAPL